MYLGLIWETHSVQKYNWQVLIDRAFRAKVQCGGTAVQGNIKEAWLTHTLYFEAKVCITE